MPFFRWIDCK